MEKMINELFETLEQQIKVYERMLSLSKDKTDLVVEGKVPELENLVKMEQALVAQIGRLEQQRDAVTVQIAHKLGQDTQTFDASQMMQHLNNEQRSQLNDYRQRLIDIIGELKQNNDLNAKLIQQSLEYIEFSMNLLTNASVPGNEYENKGTAKQTIAKKNLFDVKL